MSTTGEQEAGTRVLREALRRLVRHLEVKDSEGAWDDYHAARMLVGRADAGWDDAAAGRGIESIRREALGVEEPAGSQPDERGVALIKAIRAIAVDDTQEERAALLRRLTDAVRAVMRRDLPREALVEQIVSGITSAADKIDASTANERAALRSAAEAYFGGDFSKPEDA